MACGRYRKRPVRAGRGGKTGNGHSRQFRRPHIKAATREDALFVQGYVTAQDRLWQMDIMRRAAAGELSEVVGRATIELDREARRLRIGRLAEEHSRTLPPQDRAYLAAYARE